MFRCRSTIPLEARRVTQLTEGLQSLPSHRIKSLPWLPVDNQVHAIQCIKNLRDFIRTQHPRNHLALAGPNRFDP